MTRKDEAMQMLDQLQDALVKCEKAPKENTPTMKAFLVVMRAVYWLLERWIREKGD